MGWMTDETGLDKNQANYVALTPLSHLRRAAVVFANLPAVSYGTHRKTYAEYYARCSQLASALQQRGVSPGDVVATLIPNLPAQAEAHFGVPACGAVLNTINTRLDTGTVSYIFAHGGAKIVLVDSQFLSLAEAACADMEGEAPVIIEVPMIKPTFPLLGAIKPMKICWPLAIQIFLGICPRMNGKAYPSIIPQEPRDARKAWYATTGAPI